MTKSKADKVNYFLAVAPGDEDYAETVDWLEQFFPLKASMILTNRRVVLVVGSESYVEEIWTMKNNHYRGVCHLEWEVECLNLGGEECE